MLRDPIAKAVPDAASSAFVFAVGTSLKTSLTHGRELNAGPSPCLGKIGLFDDSYRGEEGKILIPLFQVFLLAITSRSTARLIRNGRRFSGMESYKP